MISNPFLTLAKIIKKNQMSKTDFTEKLKQNQDLSKSIFGTDM